MVNHWNWLDDSPPLNFVSDLAQVGERGYIASYNILAVNNNSLEVMFVLS